MRWPKPETVATWGIWGMTIAVVMDIGLFVGTGKPMNLLWFVVHSALLANFLWQFDWVRRTNAQSRADFEALCNRIEAKDMDLLLEDADVQREIREVMRRGSW